MLAINSHPIDPETTPHPLQPFFDDLRAAVGNPEVLAIRPPRGVGVGDATTLRIASAADLYTMAVALTARCVEQCICIEQNCVLTHHCTCTHVIPHHHSLFIRWPVIPQEHLPDQPWEAHLPIIPPTELLIEPFISSDVALDGDCNLCTQGEGRWVEVACYVIGEAGAMAALTPSVIVRPQGVASGSSLHDDLQHACRGGSHAVALTPPPEGLVSTAAIEVRCCCWRGGGFGNWWLMF